MRNLIGLALGLAIAGLPAVSHAETVGTFGTKEIKDRNLLDCGYSYARVSDFRGGKAFVFVNNGTEGLVRINGNLVDVFDTAEGSGAYQSADRSVRIDSETTTGEQVGIETWLVEGTLVFTVSGDTHRVQVKGYMGC